MPWGYWIWLTIRLVSLRCSSSNCSVNIKYNVLVDYLSADDFLMHPSLMMVNMSHNKVSTVHAHAFSSMSNLKMVDFSWNRLERFSSDSFSGMEFQYNYFSCSYNLFLSIQDWRPWKDLIYPSISSRKSQWPHWKASTLFGVFDFLEIYCKI